MKPIIVTQDIIYAKSYKEKRDSVSHQLLRFLVTNGYTPFPISNNFKSFQKILKNFKFSGVILSGGNSLGDELHRDILENKMINYCKKKKIPLLGICRGMQIIAKTHNVKLYKTYTHVNKNHAVYSCSNSKISKIFNKRKVNSFHNFCIKETNKKFIDLMITDDKTIELFKLKDYPIYGMMWHPERMRSKKSNLFIKKIFR